MWSDYRKHIERMLLVFIFLFLCHDIGLKRDVEDIGARIEKKEKARWESLIRAICEVESGSNDKAVNPVSGAAGRFQQMPVYVMEVNRILGKKEYTLKDRFDSVKSREMFDIYQSHHNPTKNIDRAILIHRGKKSKSYIDKVKQGINNK